MFITVEILNWDKYNPRKDVKKSSWFRFEHNFFTNHEFHSFKDSERLLWIYMLCLASEKNAATIHIDLDHLHQHVYRNADQGENSREKHAHQALEKLQYLQMIRVRTLRGRYARVTDALRYDTNETERDDTKERGADVLEFDLPPDPPPPPKQQPSHPRITTAEELLASMPIVQRDLLTQKFGKTKFEEEIGNVFRFHTLDPLKEPRRPGEWHKKIFSWFNGIKDQGKTTSSAETEKEIARLLAGGKPK